MKDIEIWKDIQGFEGLYQASTLGNIRSVDRVITQFGHKKHYNRRMKGQIIKPKLQNSGYSVVWLSKSGKVSPYTVHRIIANTFIKPIEGSDYVNHIDGNKENNKVSNLEWCTLSENITHSYRDIGRKPSKPLSVLCVDTGEIFESIQRAAKDKGITKTSISHVIHGRNKTAGGLKWQKI